MLHALAELERGALDCQPQPADGVTYAAKIDKGETRIDFTRPRTRGARSRARAVAGAGGLVRDRSRGASGAHEGAAHRSWRRVSGPPGTVLDDALTIACGEGAVRVLEVQRSGKRPMAAGEFLRGFPLRPGTRLPEPG